MPPYITPSRYRVSRALKTRPGDVCYTSYPKSGSTWLAYILILLIHQGEEPAAGALRRCLHWVASSWTYPREEEELEALPSPRIFKSHMPYPMALGGVPHANPCKYVYIARNPKDVMVSYYHFERRKSWSGYYAGSWEHWFHAFLGGKVQRGDWFDHVLSWWEHRDAPNILFVHYEHLLSRFDHELRRLAAFLELPLSAELLETVRTKTSFQCMQRSEFSSMREIKEFGGFFRKGRIGSWREQFTAAQSREFGRIYARRMGGTGLDFEFG
jgi:hypothetical protein